MAPAYRIARSTAMTPADRLCLQEARRKGWLDAVLVVEGRPEPDGEALDAHFRSMAAAGYLKLQGRFGSRARLQSASLRVRYVPTPVGLELLEALERAEAAEAVASRVTSPAATRRSKSRS